MAQDDLQEIKNATAEVEGKFYGKLRRISQLPRICGWQYFFFVFLFFCRMSEWSRIFCRRGKYYLRTAWLRYN